MLRKLNSRKEKKTIITFSMIEIRKSIRTWNCNGIFLNARSVAGNLFHLFFFQKNRVLHYTHIHWQEPNTKVVLLLFFMSSWNLKKKSKWTLGSSYQLGFWLQKWFRKRKTEFRWFFSILLIYSMKKKNYLYPHRHIIV